MTRVALYTPGIQKPLYFGSMEAAIQWLNRGQRTGTYLLDVEPYPAGE